MTAPTTGRTWRYPVLLLEDREGFCTGILAGCAWRGTAAVGEDARDVLHQLRSLILSARDEHPGAPWFTAECRLTTVSVPVRPRVLHDGRAYPAQGLVPFRAACVWGKVDAGFLTCEVPQLGLTFDLMEESELREMVGPYVRSHLEERTPREVLRLLNAASFELGEVRVPVPAEAEDPSVIAALTRELSRSAEPIPSRAMRAPSTAGLGREEAAATLVERVAETRANLLLVGATGVGKTALLLDVAGKAEARMARPAGAPKVPRFWWTSGARLIAGMAYLGEWQARCDRIVAELQGCDGYLCVDNLMGLVRAAGGPAEAGPGAYLQDFLARGELRLIAEATPEELDACRRLVPALAASLEVFPVPPLERPIVLRVLERLARDRSASAAMTIEPGVLERTVDLFARFRPYETMPGRATGFLAGLFEPGARGRGAELTVADAVGAFARETGLPDLFLRDEAVLATDAVEAWFRAQVIGQEEACREAARTATVFKAGLNDPRRPAACLLFAGPTGVGKTEMARSLARFFFGHGEKPEERLVRLDMSEYAGPDAAERLLGDPEGRPGSLLARVRRQPFCVVLLDEIEKAAHEIFDILLTLLDEGKLTDAYGRTTHFRSALVVLTSNLGGAHAESLGFAKDRAPDYEAEVRAFFRPEFFNRLDRVVRFRPLAPATVAAIARKELAAIERRDGVAKRGLRLEWSDRLVRRLTSDGFDTRYGARPLQRVLEDAVVAPLGRFLIERPLLRDVRVRAELGEGGQATFQAV